MNEQVGVGLDEFLKHSNRANNAGWLKWRDKGEAKVWIHPQTWTGAPRDADNKPQVAIWNHKWFRVIEVEDKDGDKVMKVVQSRFVSHEPEKVLKKQYFRDDEGEREHPPVVCPMSFLTDWVYRAIKRGDLDWTTPLFHFEGDDPDQAVTLHAGGVVGLFNARDLSKEQKQQLKNARISPKESWKENLMARCQYLFLVVDDEDPDAGVLKATEADAIGKGMRKAMKDEMTRKGSEKGNPMRRPYPFLWRYDDDKQPNEKYSVIALEDEPRKEILELLREEAPDVSADYQPGDCALLRAEMEAHLCEGVSVPFDEIFAAAEKTGLMKPRESAPKKPAGKENEPKAEEEKVCCDFCLSELADDDVFCSNCGTTYDEETFQIDGLPCLSGNKDGRCSKTGKKEAVSVVRNPKEPNQTRFVCEKCATIHELRPGGEPVAKRWSVVKEPKKVEPPKEKAAPKGRRAAKAAGGSGRPFQSSDTMPPPFEDDIPY